MTPNQSFVGMKGQALTPSSTSCLPYCFDTTRYDSSLLRNHILSEFFCAPTSIARLLLLRTGVQEFPCSSPGGFGPVQRLYLSDFALALSLKMHSQVKTLHFRGLANGPVAPANTSAAKVSGFGCSRARGQGLRSMFELLRSQRL